MKRYEIKYLHFNCGFLNLQFLVLIARFGLKERVYTLLIKCLNYLMQAVGHAHRKVKEKICTMPGFPAGFHLLGGVEGLWEGVA